MSGKKKEIFNDERFAHLLKNPRFTKLPKSKVKIDDRFKNKLKEESFAVQPFDKYGRRSNKSTSDELKKYYDISSSDESEDEEKIEGNAIIKGGNVIPEQLKEKLKNLEVDYLRGEGAIQSDSSDEGSSSDGDEDDAVEHEWGQLDQDAERTEDSTRRIALMHMDWDRLRAIDIMILLNSFIPKGTGSILSVNIYPSEFGKERMADEELNGPKELTTVNNGDDQTAVDEESEEYREKVRQYQLNRLKYFYAVVEFDSVAVADVVYKECDGLEYESTANRLDLRFIPDDMEFDDEPKDTCTELPDLSTLAYEPRMFFTSALQHANVELTWDETDVSRKEISEKLFTDRKNEIMDHELKKFVACSSSESEEEDEDSRDEDALNAASSSQNTIQLYKSLLSEINDKEEEKRKNQMEMEYTWSIGGGGGSKATENNESDNQEEITPFEKIIEKKKRKSKLKKLANKGKQDSKEKDGYSSSDFDDIDMNDPFFAEEFQNDEFEKPKKKKNKNRKKMANDDESEEALKAKNDLELLLEDENDSKSHFSLKEIQKNEEISSKKKKKLKKLKKGDERTTDNFELNVADPRFNAVFSNPDFNIDPTDPNFKKTKNYDKLIKEKLKRRYNSNDVHVAKKSKH